MLAYQWSDDMSVGVQALDIHHKRLISLLNELSAAITEQDCQAVTGKVLGELIRYTYYHFGEEERLMEVAGYGDLAAHRQSHRILADHVRAMEADYDANPCTVAAADLLQFLSEWLLHHIHNEDCRYAPVLSERLPSF